MEKKYRITEKALPYFDNKYASKIQSKSTWINNNVSVLALEEVEDCYISFGIDKGNSVTHLSGWSSLDNTFHLDFTINFTDADHAQYISINNDLKIRSLMDEIQRLCSEFYNENRLF